MKADSPEAQEYCTHLLRQLVDIPSVFPEEAQIIAFLERELASLGFSPTRYELEEGRVNLLCRHGSGSPRLCLNAHSDTVPANGESTPQARIKGDTLYGLGACDTKASIASMVTAFRELASGDTPGSVDLLISVDEEGGGKGVKAAIAQGYSCHYAIVGEPTSLRCVRAHHGLLFLKLTTEGVAAHGCQPNLGVNSIHRMMELVEEIRAATRGFAPHPVCGGPSLNLGEIHAGDRPNRVPEKCVARIDIRFPAPATSDDALQAAKNVIYSKQWASCEIEKHGEALDTPPDSPLVKAIRASAQELAISSELAGLRGWTEAEPFHTLLGIDAVVLGPGGIEQAHTSNEFVSIPEMHKAAAFYVAIARQLCD
jgi:acetylornithine deacetylase